jgi:hypothetical protein
MISPRPAISFAYEKAAAFWWSPESHPLKASAEALQAVFYYSTLS